MPTKAFTADAVWDVGLEAKCDAGYYCLAYDGDLGGGSLELWTNIDGLIVPVPNGKLDDTMLDDNGDLVQMVIFSAAGSIIVELDGATDPDVTVAVR